MLRLEIIEIDSKLSEKQKKKKLRHLGVLRPISMKTRHLILVLVQMWINSPQYFGLFELDPDCFKTNKELNYSKGIKNKRKTMLNHSFTKL